MPAKSTFSGFHEGEGKPTSLPATFFSELLPVIDHLAELKVTLYAFWVLGTEREEPEYLRVDDFQSDQLLMDGLAAKGLSAAEALQEALERAVQRGSLLRAEVEFGREKQALYFLNARPGQAALRKIEQGEWVPSGDPGQPVELRTARPNVFNLYEQNIGALTPMLAEELRDAEQRFPEEWLEEAIRIAVLNNVRKWRYIAAILEDWKSSGKDEREPRGDTEKARRRYVQGKFADYQDE